MQKATCDMIYDHLLEDDLSPDVMDHLKHCESCRTDFAIIRRAKKEGSSLYQRRLPDRFATEVFKKITALIEPSLGERILSLLQRRSFQVAFVAMVVLLIFGIHFRFHSPVVSSPEYIHSFQLSFLSTGKTETRACSVPWVIGTEACRIDSPDGSILEFQGPGQFTIFPRGFTLDRGSLRLWVKKEPDTYQGSTPHCLIRVVGTHFSVSVSGKTEIRVHEGKVAVFPTKGEARTLKGGELMEVPVPKAVSAPVPKIPARFSSGAPASFPVSTKSSDLPPLSSIDPELPEPVTPSPAVSPFQQSSPSGFD